MKTKRIYYRQFIELILITMLATTIGMISGGAAVFTAMNYKDEDDITVEPGSNEITEMYNQILSRYYKDVDKDALIDGAIDGMLSVLGDPNSFYFDEVSKETFDEKMLGQYYGAGFEILADKDGKVYIVNLFEGAPAKKAGIKVGDYILKINDESMEGKSATEISSLVKYGDGEDVKITINRDGKELDFNIKKQVIELTSVNKKVYNKNNKKIGYLQVTVFASNTYEQFENAFNELKKENIDSLIIDLRSNTGGYLTVVTNMLELLLKEGDILYKLESKTETTITKDETKDSVNYPIVVLINEYSASASEVMAAALKENIDAKLVGIKSYGKGTVQETVETSSGGMAKFTTKRWLTPNGDCVDGIGITPDYEIELSEEYLRNNIDENDNQLQKAIEVITK